MVAKVFLSHQICSLSKIYEVTIITNISDQGSLLSWVPENVAIMDIPIQREVHLYYDLKVLYLL